MSENKFLVLKGRHIIAQGNSGFTGSRPGLINVFEIRPSEKVWQREFLYSDEMELLFFMGVTDFRPKGHNDFVQRFPADGLSSVTYTQGGVSDRSSRNSTLGYYILALQAGKSHQLSHCIKLA